MCSALPKDAQVGCTPKCPSLIAGTATCDDLCNHQIISQEQRTTCSNSCQEIVKNQTQTTTTATTSLAQTSVAPPTSGAAGPGDSSTPYSLPNQAVSAGDGSQPTNPAALPTDSEGGLSSTPQKLLAADAPKNSSVQANSADTSSGGPLTALGSITQTLLGSLLPSSQSSSSQASSSRTYTTPIFTAANSTAGVVYSPNTNQVLDAFTPQGDTATNRPAIIFIHGGSFTGGTRTSFDATAQEFTNYGYVTFSIDYRLCQNTPPLVWTNTPSPLVYGCLLQARQDTESAISWVRNNATQYGVDPNKIILLGSSAGAIDALYVGLEPLSVRAPLAVVSDAGAILQPDLSQVNANSPAVMFLHGAQDTVVPTAAGQATYSTLQSLGVPSEWNVFEGVGHIVPITPTIVAQIATFLAKYVN
jgi:acetyl esterase/lipase